MSATQELNIRPEFDREIVDIVDYDELRDHLKGGVRHRALLPARHASVAVVCAAGIPGL